MSKTKQIEEDFGKYVASKGGSVAGKYVNSLAPIKVVCSYGHIFSLRPTAPATGVWCADCKKITETNTLPMLFEKLGIIPETNFLWEETEAIFNYKIEIDDTEIVLIDILKHEEYTSGFSPELSGRLKDKLRIAEEISAKYLLLDAETITDAVKTEAFLDEAISNESTLTVSIGDWKKIFEKSDRVVMIEPELIPGKKASKKDGESYYEIFEDVSPEIESIIGYTRVSTGEQRDEGFSLETQRAIIIEFANKEKRPLRCIYTDAGIGGKDILNRPAIKLALAGIRRGEILAVANLTRLSRRAYDSLGILDDLKKKNSWLRTLDPFNIDTRDPSSVMYCRMITIFGETEREMIIGRVTATMGALSATGQLKTKPPFGWKFVGKGKPFEEDPKEQATIEYIRKLRKENPLVSINGLCKKLDEHPAHGCRNAKKWYCGVLKKVMISNGIIDEPPPAGYTEKPRRM
jgi:DNA invertase Pin-like site-specific DNA recombinase